MGLQGVHHANAPLAQEPHEIYLKARETQINPLADKVRITAFTQVGVDVKGIIANIGTLSV